LAVKEIGIIVNGATGRIASTQHLTNALVPLRAEGGLTAGADRIVPRLLLVGRNAERLTEIARTYSIDGWTTNLDEALVKPDFSVFFDAAATKQRVSTLTKAIAAGKQKIARYQIKRPIAKLMCIARGS
jgi:predicted dehydrogenase